ncbi:MAG: large conductance mechanosensitive channel protein MscL [Clostridia bacterium]|nr:large conductance mechanosensitive channel protein MscL [Clostridia bacterium]
MKKFFQEFKKFITRGNVLDMSVGVIVGGAFTAIVNGLTNNILKPLVNWLLALILGNNGLESAVTVLSPAYDAEGALDLAKSIYIDWGAFVSAIINFLLIALVLFTIVRAINFANSEMARAKKLGGALTKEEIKTLRKQGKSRKEIKALQQQRLADVAEQARIAAEEAAKNAPKTEQQLLAEIVELLKDQQK